MKKHFLTVAFLGGVKILSAQEVVSTSGTVHTNSSGSIEWTMGEAVIETVTDGTNSATQGFHQNQLQVTMVEEIETFYQVNIFPNPTQSFVKIEIKDLDHDLKLQLFDISGKLIQETTYWTGSGSNTIDLKTY